MINHPTSLAYWSCECGHESHWRGESYRRVCGLIVMSCAWCRRPMVLYWDVGMGPNPKQRVAANLPLPGTGGTTGG
jgi:hypothetical protein